MGFSSCHGLLFWFDSDNTEHRVGPGVSLSPAKGVSVQAKYNVLFAQRNNLARVRAVFSRRGNFRGQLATAILKHTINKHIKHYIMGEVFVPGNYYCNARNDVATFARYQIELTW